jgi:hypothetical protein
MHFTLDSKAEDEIELFLFRDVRNARAVRKRVVAGELDAAALNAELVGRMSLIHSETRLSEQSPMS